MESVLEQLIGTLAEATFFKELCFTGQTFAATSGESKELADAYVWLETEALVIQVKEREDSSRHKGNIIARWFKRKVIDKGSSQIADTISFLNDHPDVRVKNARGREFTLRELNVEPRHNVIVFGTLSDPTALRQQLRAHQSGRSGLIHLIEAVDFRNLLRLAVTPRELFDYLAFREKYLARHAFARAMSEKWIFGRFVYTTELTAPDADTESWDGGAVVDSLVDDTPEIDLRLFFDHIGEWAATRDGGESIFHKLILECAHLSRAGMREFKRRGLKCQQRLDRPGPETLYRIVNPARDCVFVFGVMPKEMIDKVEIGALNLVQLAKYECRTSKALGFFTTPVGDEDVATTPVYLEQPWEQNQIGEAMLKEFNPFRPLKGGILYGYSVDECVPKEEG